MHIRIYMDVMVEAGHGTPPFANYYSPVWYK